jgi:hypothetical protein
VAAADGFVFFAVKDAQILGQTALWTSDGGRSYAPWSSRHRAVLGIEEACSHFGDGRLASSAPNAYSERGYRTSIALRPDGEVIVRYALGAIPAPAGWTEIADIRWAGGSLILTDVGGETRTVPFDTGFIGAS